LTDQSFDINSENMPRTKEQFEKMRESSREQILKAAFKLFAQNGYSGTSINDIAKAAGVSKGLAYNYFKSKQHILEILLMQLFDEFNVFERALSKISDPYEQIQTIIKLTLEMIEQNKEMWLLYTGLAFQPSVLSTIKQRLNSSAERFYKLVEKPFKKIRIKNAPTEAKILAASLDGIILHYLMLPEVYPIKKIKKQIMLQYSKEQLEHKIH